jgi:LPS sulfotransferase NodH
MLSSISFSSSVENLLRITYPLIGSKLRGDVTQTRDLGWLSLKGMLDYVICSTPRVGRQFLAQQLAATHNAGAPAEYFEPEVMQGELQHIGFADVRDALSDIDGYVAALRRMSATSNGAFGIKLHRSQLDLAFEHGFSLTRHMRSVRLVRLRRADRLAQAISLDKARQTRSWNSLVPPSAEPVYDRHRIIRWMSLIAGWEREWSTFLSRQGRPVLPVSYEQLATNRVEIVSRVLDFLGVDLPEDVVHDLPMRFHKQRDGISRAWMERFRRGE